MKFLIEFLNRIKLFPYYVVTPIPYALGTAAIDILYGVNKAKMKNKKLIFIAPSVGQKFLNYNICNEALFNGLLVDGVNIASYNATNSPSTADYVTSFSEISAGTTTTTTAAVTAVTLNRTGW